MKKVDLFRLIWKHYKFKPAQLRSDREKPYYISRQNRSLDDYSIITVSEDSPRVIKGLNDNMSFVDKIGCGSHFMKKMGIVRGIGLDSQREEMLENGQSVFAEVLRATRENDFSQLSEVTFGGMKTLEFHRKAASKLNSGQLEALKFGTDDFLGQDGFILQYSPIQIDRDGLSWFIHDINYVSMDATDEKYMLEDGKPKVYLRYKLILGALRQQMELMTELKKNYDPTWEQKMKLPKGYGFESPRIVFVELDICQEVVTPPTIPLKLYDERMLYDFHLFVL